jgi:hypothetical protein
MTKASASYVTNGTTADAASYRGWGGPISGAISSVLARTNATGQVNWSTVAAPAAGATTRDYEVYAFTDALQATKPVFIRLNWAGYYSATPVYPSLGFVVGTASDAAGTITGNTATGQIIAYSAAPTSQTRLCYASSDGSQLILVTQSFGPATVPTTNNYEQLGTLVVERTRDADGTPNGNGFMVWYWLATQESATVVTNNWSRLLLRSFDGVVTSGSTNGVAFDMPVFMPGIGSSGNGPKSQYVGNNTLIWPAYTYTDASQVTGPSRAVALHHSSDVARLGIVPMTLGASTLQMMSIGSTNPVNISYSTTQTASSLFTMTPMVRME